MNFEQRLKELKLDVPVLSKPAGVYLPAVKAGNLVFSSGQLPLADNRLTFKGRVGKEVSADNAQRAAKIATLNALAAIKWSIGDLNKIKKIVRLTGYICSAIGWNDQAKVMNSASELLIDVFGEEVGSHSRVSIGVLELPMGACLELDLIVEVK